MRMKRILKINHKRFKDIIKDNPSSLVFKPKQRANDNKEIVFTSGTTGLPKVLSCLKRQFYIL